MVKYNKNAQYHGGNSRYKICIRFMINALNNSNWSSAPKIKYASHNAKKNQIKVKL